MTGVQWVHAFIIFYLKVFTFLFVSDKVGDDDDSTALNIIFKYQLQPKILTNNLIRERALLSITF